MKKTTPILCLLISFFSIYISAQQTPHYTQYVYNMEVFNPAAVGSRSDFSISFLTRHQWAGIEGAPSTQTFSVNGRTNNGIGLGTTVVYDKIGLAENTNVNIDASYTIVTSVNGRLALGLKGGVSFFNNNLAQGITPDNDTYASTSGSYPNIGFGALYYNRNYFIGASIPYLLKISQFNIDEASNLPEIADNLNYFVTGGMKFYLTDDIQIKPSTIIKYNSNLPISIDLNANVLYKNYFEAGLSYRYNDAISALIAFTINEKIRIGYSYDQQISSVGTNLGSHEIMILMDFDLDRKGRWLEHTSCYF